MILLPKRPSLRFTLALVLGAWGLGATGDAQAQAWLEDRTRREGPGIRAGNLELHPGAAVEGGYDSNVYLSQSGEQRDSFVLRITPHLDLSTLGPERREGSDRKVAFRMGAAMPVYLFFSPTVRQRTLLGALGNFDLTFRPDGDISFKLYDQYERRVRPFTERGAGSYALNRNALGATFKAGTKGGVYVARLNYELGLDVFEDSAFDYLNNAEHRARFNMFWNFFPKTSLFFDSQVSHQVYFGEYLADASARFAYMLRRAQNTRVAASVGLNGAITSKVSVLAQVGYAAAIVHDDLLADTETVIGKLFFTMRPRETLTLRVGYERDIHPAFSGAYYTLDRGLAELETMLKGRFLLGGRVWAGYLASGTVLAAEGGTISPDGDTERTDVIVNSTLFGEYRLKDWFAITASGAVIYDKTGFRYNRFFYGVVPPDPANFYKFEVWLGARVFY